MKSKFASVDYELKEIPQQAVWDGVLQAGSKWAYVDEEDARNKMRDVYENIEKWQQVANELQDSYEGEQYYYDKFIEELAIEFEEKDVVIL